MNQTAASSNCQRDIAGLPSRSRLGSTPESRGHKAAEELTQPVRTSASGVTGWLQQATPLQQRARP